MVTYEVIIKLKKANLFKEAINTGLVPFHWLTWTQLYEFHKMEVVLVPSRMQAITNTADKFGYSESRTREIINYFK